jgi:hypothetical protein
LCITDVSFDRNTWRPTTPSAPPHSGVTDGIHQYVLNLRTGEGAMLNMAAPLIWNIDRSSEEPEAARELRDDLYSRFPDLPRK